MRKLYYLRDFTDEVLPCSPELDAWAAWLAAPCEPGFDYGKTRVARPGDLFACDVMERLPNIEARLVDGAWVTPPLDAGTGYQGADFFAVAEGSGWDHEQSGDTPDVALCEYAADGSDGDEVTLAVGRSLPSVMVRFEIGEGGPRLVEAGPVQ